MDWFMEEELKLAVMKIKKPGRAARLFAAHGGIFRGLRPSEPHP